MPVNFGNLRILVVDRDQELRNLTHDMLDTIEISQVYTVSDGGRTFGELRDREFGMVTAALSLQDVTEARDVGVSEFLTRPFSVDSLRSRVAAIINNSRAFIQVESYFGPDRRRVNKEFKGEDMRGRKS